MTDLRQDIASSARTASRRAGAPRTLLALAVAGALGASAHAQFPGASLGVEAGTLGVGLVGGVLFTSHFGGRATLNGLVNYSTTQTNTGITYDGKLSLQNVPLLLDWYPKANGSFRFSGGIILNKNKVTANGVIAPGDSIKIGGTYYTEAALGGPLVGTVTYPTTAWYAGIGVGTPHRGKSRWGFLFDFGVMISTPTAHLTAPNAATDPALQQDLDAQVAKSQQDLKKYATYWPQLALGVNYRF